MLKFDESVELRQCRERIYTDFKDKVARYVRGKISNEQDAQDIVSDVFIKVFEGLCGYDESKASLSTWIYTIARNAVIDYFRSAKRYCELPENLCCGDDTEERMLNEEALERLADALMTLEERERDIIILRYYNGESLKRIAGMMNISYSYAKLLHASSLKTLRKMLAD